MIADLGPGDRLVVGLDVASTATALGMSATAVRVAHHRGLKKLRLLDADLG